MPCDLSDGDAVTRLVEGCDGIVHLGGISVEKSFDLIEAANLRGVHNLYAKLGAWESTILCEHFHWF